MGQKQTSELVLVYKQEHNFVVVKREVRKQGSKLNIK